MINDGYGKDTSLALHDGGTTTYAASVLKKIVTPEESERKPIQVHEIVQIHNMYLVIPTKTGMVLIDQHAAHERVLFERFQKAFLDEKLRGEAVALKKIQQLSLSLSEKELLEGHMKELERLGFDIHEVKNIMEVRQVPALFQDRDIVKLIRDVLDDLSSDETLKKYDAFSNTMLEYLSCRSAIKAGDKLTKLQAKDLIDELNLTENPYTCPHGRPIQIVMEKDYLDHLFKRK